MIWEMRVPSTQAIVYIPVKLVPSYHKGSYSPPDLFSVYGS